MAEEWAVFMRDDLGVKHVERVQADSQPQAISEAKSRIQRPTVVKRVRRVLNELRDMEWVS